MLSRRVGRRRGALELRACSIVRIENQIACDMLRLEVFLGVVLCGCASGEIIADPCRTRKCTVWAQRGRL